MLRTRRRAATVITAAAAATVTAITLAVPAQALTAPAWPTAGRAPVGCEPNVVFTTSSPTAWTYTYTDSTFPTVADARVSSGATNVTALAPAGADIKVWLKLVDSCSGVVGAIFTASRNGVNGSLGGSVTNTTTDAFNSWWNGSIGTIRPDDAGVYKVPAILTARRYDSFVLDQDFKYVSSIGASASVTTAGAWSQKPSYLLRVTTLSNALSATRLKKGKTVKATAVLKMATNAGYAADASAKVFVQTKVGTGKWVTNAALTTNASGVVSYSFVLTATTQVRFVHARTLSGKFTNGVVSPIKVVTKI